MRSLKIIILISFLLISHTYATSAFDIKWGTDLMSNQRSNTLKQWAESMEGRVGTVGTNPGRGGIYYVDSNVDNEGDGTSWADARDTLDEAVSLADPNSIIYIAQGHTESMGTGTDVVDIDVQGLTIIQVGNPLVSNGFDYTDYDTGSFAIGADNITLVNMRFHSNTPDVNEAIEIEAGSVGVNIIGCIFDVETAATDEFHECISSDSAGNHNLRVIGCEFYMGAGAARSGIEFRDCDYAQILNNKFAGDYAIADINNATTASDHITIAGNEIVNGTIGGAAGLNAQPCIELKSDTSGVIANNLLICNVATPDAAIVGADMYCIGNVYSETEGGVSSAPMWLTTDTADNVIGYDDNDNAYASTNVAANADGSIIERLEQIDVDTSAIATDTALMDTAAEMVLLTGTPLVVTDTTSAMGGGDYQAADDPVIFTVTGDILCRAAAYATTQVTSTSNDTLELGTAGDTACLLIQDVVDGTAFDVGFAWTLISAPDDTAGQMADEWTFIGNGEDIVLTINDHDITAGVLVFYLQYIPLSSGATVVGAAP